PSPLRFVILAPKDPFADREIGIDRLAQELFDENEATRRLTGFRTGRGRWRFLAAGRGCTCAASLGERRAADAPDGRRAVGQFESSYLRGNEGQSGRLLVFRRAVPELRQEVGGIEGVSPGACRRSGAVRR